MCDYAGALGFIILIAGFMTTVEQTQGQRFVLYTVAVFAWLSTPIIRRTIERLVPFR
jgi:hypothetical protein